MATDLRKWIAARAAAELTDGDHVNLGVGIPTGVPAQLTSGVRIFFHSENGMLGVGVPPAGVQADPDIIDAGKRPVSEQEHTSYFDSAFSFGMIRGGHIDVAIVGALQVDVAGRIANWAVPGRSILGVGGAMDLLVGARRVIVTMTHRASDGTAKLVPQLTLPATGSRSVDLIITDLGVFAPGERGLRLLELAPGVSVAEVEQHTKAPVEDHRGVGGSEERSVRGVVSGAHSPGQEGVTP